MKKELQQKIERTLLDLLEYYKYNKTVDQKTIRQYSQNIMATILDAIIKRTHNTKEKGGSYNGTSKRIARNNVIL